MQSEIRRALKRARGVAVLAAWFGQEGRVERYFERLESAIDHMELKLFRATGGRNDYECSHGVALARRCRECERTWKEQK